MRRTGFAVVAAVAAISLMLLPGRAAADVLEDLKAENDALRAELGQLRTEMRELRKQNRVLEETVEALKEGGEPSSGQSRGSSQRIAELEREVEQLRSAKQAAEAEAEQVKARRAEAYIGAYTDEQSGTRIVATHSRKLDITHGSRAEHWLRLEARYGGEGGPRLSADLQTAFSGKEYQHVDAITFEADGRPVSLAVRDYDHQRRMMGGRNRKDIGDEFLTLAITADQLRQLAAAERITGSIKFVRFTVDPDMREAIRAFAQQVDQ